MKNIHILMWCLILSSCSPPPTQISGQAFIVQKNRETIKLSLMEVVLITDAEAEARITVIKKSAQEKAAGALKRAEETRKKIALLQKVKADLSKEMHILNLKAEERLKYYDLVDGLPIQDPERFRKAMKSDTPDQALNKAGEFLKEGRKLGQYYTNAVADLEKENETLAEAEREIGIWAGPMLYFQEDWTNVLAKCLTDADGNFTITAKQSGYLAAKASRQVFDNAEFYGWIIKPEKGKTILSNHNSL